MTNQSFMIAANILRACAEECKRQQSGEMSVYHMTEAVLRLVLLIDANPGMKLEKGLIISLGRMIEPEMCTGIRTVPVHFADGTFAMNAASVDRALDSLIEAQDELSPEEFYQEFEKIHPFVDGNGRVGFILYNILRGTLDFPTPAPEFKK